MRTWYSVSWSLSNSDFFFPQTSFSFSRVVLKDFPEPNFMVTIEKHLGLRPTYFRKCCHSCFILIGELGNTWLCGCVITYQFPELVVSIFCEVCSYYFCTVQPTVCSSTGTWAVWHTAVPQRSCVWWVISLVLVIAMGKTFCLTLSVETVYM